MRILIADDHPIICVALGELLKAALGEDLASLDTVADSDTLLARYPEAACDLLVLDLMMPGRVGNLQLLERVVQLRRDIPVVVYSGAQQPLLALHALEAGARAFVSKASGVGLALDAVRVVAAGGTYVDPNIDLEHARRHPWNDLTAGERSVIVSLAGGAHLLALALDTERSYKTVTAHKYAALRKLGLSSKTDLKHYLSQIGLGYLLP
jgi:two-component system capsular synthesis response regulator RcsB